MEQSTITNAKAQAKPEKIEDRSAFFNHVEVVCEAILGDTKITIKDLNALSKGDVVKLDQGPSHPVDIRVNGKVIAQGEIVTVDNNFGVRVTSIS